MQLGINVILIVHAPHAIESVTKDNVANHFRKVRHFMYCYPEGLAPGRDLDKKFKKYKKSVKSHRRIGENE